MEAATKVERQAAAVRKLANVFAKSRKHPILFAFPPTIRLLVRKLDEMKSDDKIDKSVFTKGFLLRTSHGETTQLMKMMTE